MPRVYLEGKFCPAQHIELAPTTRIVKESHWAYWSRFCRFWGVEAVKYRSLRAITEEGMILRLKVELDVIDAFADLILIAPRTTKGIRTTICVNYAEKLLSSIRGHYAGIHGRRPGLSNGELGGKQFRYRLDGLLILAPSRESVKRPVLQSDLRRISTVMNLKECLNV